MKYQEVLKNGVRKHQQQLGHMLKKEIDNISML